MQEISLDVQNLFNPKVKRCLLILASKPQISLVKEKHSIGKKFHSLAVQEQKLLTNIAL